MMATVTTLIAKESRLVLRAQSGDGPALGTLLEGTQTWLRPYLRSVLTDQHLADEVMQEVFLLIFRKLRFLHQPRAYRAWVYRTATRQAFRHINKQRSHPGSRASADDLDEVPATPQEGPPDAAWLARCRSELQTLPPNTRAVIVLHYFEGLSIRQVADVLDIATGTAKSRLASGLALLRERLPAESA